MNLEQIAATLGAEEKARLMREEKEKRRQEKEELRKRKKILEAKENLCLRFRKHDNLFGCVCDGRCPLAQIKVSGSGGYECAEIHDRDFTTDYLYDAITTDGWTPPDDWKRPEHREICRSFYSNMKNKEETK